MDLSSIVKSQRDYFNTNATKDIAFRRNSLEKLLDTIYENEPAIYSALRADLGKAEMESYMTEVGLVISAIKYAIKHLEIWSRTRRVRTPMVLWPGSSKIIKEPYGVVLIMAPWNYPFGLSMMPLIGALAAGNCVIIKTSKSSPATSGVIVDLINSTFEKNHVYAIEQVIAYNDILDQKYDYIFFTGSERVGKTVMRAAADNLTPVTLELGGKSPCIVDPSADIDMAARKIMWGKILNAGQTCVAPDYVLVHENVKDELIAALKKYAKELVGGDPFNNPDYPHIVSLHHYMRLMNMIDKEEVVIGGRGDDKRLLIEPTILPEATYESVIMKAEIFGPVLPVITYDDTLEMVALLKHQPKPLACYIFSRNDDFITLVTETVPYGGGCINDIIMHVASEHLPFGGVGASGMGKYHGKASFDTFTHEKSVYSSTADMDFRYPPYKDSKLDLVKKFLK